MKNFALLHVIQCLHTGKWPGRDAGPCSSILCESPAIFMRVQYVIAPRLTECKGIRVLFSRYAGACVAAFQVATHAPAYLLNVLFDEFRNQVEGRAQLCFVF